ncbi:phytanoyl-CoA dioxygenase family protein [Microbulbifer sp. EKSA005]|uniref:phytanoyl-CoA dioxygenase family protein n=1 Tax=Microbulbifer sp. EKSA005 TaxID=3243364 RepID=UPI0040414FF9
MLTDNTKETSCLSMLPKSHTDTRTSYLYNFIQDNKLICLSLVPASPRSLYRLAKLFLLLSTREIIEKDLFGDLEVKDLEVKAGECLIFSPLNMHTSYANTSKDKSRFSFVRGCTANHVKVAPYGKDNISTMEGLQEFTLPKVGNFQVFGKDSYDYNEILDDNESTSESVLPLLLWGN